jgi:hypothetical protein
MPLYLLSPVFLLSAIVFVLATIDLVLEMDGNEGVLTVRGVIDVVTLVVSLVIIFIFN